MATRPSFPALCLLLAITLTACRGEPEGYFELDLQGNLADQEEAGFGGGGALTMRQLLTLLRLASEDDEVSGVLVRFGPIGAGPARIEEVRDSLLRLRESGRTVHCHLESGSNYSYWLAAAGCERIALSPGGSLDLTGLAAESIYFRQLLDTVGLEADVMRVGTHKGAAEFLTEDDMSPETRETLNELLDDLTALLAEGISEGRRLDEGAARDLLGSGPYTANQALEAGLVDALEYHDQAREALEEALPGEPRRLEDWVEETGARQEGGLLRALTGPRTAGAVRGQRVAVLYLSGPIARQGGGSLLGPQISQLAVRRALAEIRDDEQIRALVIRIDSPGGSALASDEIWHDVLEIRSNVPVVASMGDVAASGGYYIASAATEILAGRGTLTGSIGVVGGKLVAEELMHRVGARPVMIRRGENAGLESFARPFTTSQREALQLNMVAAYDRFVSSIVRGRVMDEEAVRRLATGRVWTGTRAVELGLVDDIGGLHDAIELARELAELPADAPVQAFPRQTGLLEQLQQGPSMPGALVRGLPAGRGTLEALPMLGPGLDTALLLHDEPVLALWPDHVIVR